MASASGGESRDLTLAHFQAVSGIDDIETCLSLLESYDWDLQTALNSLFAEDRSNLQPQSTKTSRVRGPSPIDVDTPPPFINLDPDPIPIPVEDDETETNIIIFQILWHEVTLPITINDTETVGTLKQMLETQTGLNAAEMNLEGWPRGESSINDSTRLKSLSLCSEVHLVLTTPAKVTVTPAEYLPCNIPACNVSDNEENEALEPPRVINVEKDFGSSSKDIILVVNHNSRDYKLCYEPSKTVKNVKQEVNLLTKIPSSQQQWSGWPDGATDKSRLGDLGLANEHILIVTEKASSSRNTATSSTFLNQPLDSGLTGSPEDIDLDDPMIDGDDDDFFDTDDMTPSNTQIKLLPRDSADTEENLRKFNANFEERYGSTHPQFFIGSLKDAIDDAGGSSAAESRPLLVYLHHDSSILTNVFCSEILCSQQLIQYVSLNFVIWPWDMSHESNRQRFVNLLVQFFGHTAANTVSKYKNTEYPLLLIVMKSKSGLEVCSVLQANASLDEVMIGLIHGYEVFEQAQLVEIKAEAERKERETMKKEQDDAFQKSLAADQAKADAEKVKEMEIKEQQEKEHLEAQIKEAERISCEDQLPDEPEEHNKLATRIRLRLPEGDNVERRFLSTDSLSVLFMFVASKGYSSNDYQIVTNFPRRKLAQEDAKKTFKELQLFPRANLFVEEI